MVEDNPADQFLVTELLSLSPVSIRDVAVCGSISDALGLIRTSQPDIILLDLSLPDGSGIHTFRKVKEHASHIPIVILSGFNDISLVFEAITQGAQDYLVKGDFDEKLLAKTILYSIERMQSIITTEELLRTSEEKKQKEIADAVISAQENERQEIGRELHDNINQLLTTSRLYLEMLGAKTEKDQALISETSRFIDTAIAEIRRLSHTLIPPSLDRSELKASLIYIFDITAKSTGLSFVRDFTGFDENDASDKLKLTIYRIVQEQISNIIKHARATTVLIRLTQENGKTLLMIKDDGAGFDPSVKPNGIGLKNIRARASLFNGQVQIISAPGQGCEVRILFK